MGKRMQIKAKMGLAIAGCAVMGLASFLGGHAIGADQPAKVDFNKDIKPIFETSCVKCHHVDANDPKVKPRAGFRLDDKTAALKGGRDGVAIVPGKADDSLLYKLLKGPVKNGDDEIDAMPKPAKKGAKWEALPQEQIDLIKRWIDEGADWPS